MPPLFAFLDSPLMILILGIVAVLLFGERLPEVVRSFGKGLMEFKKGVHSIREDVEEAINTAASDSSSSRSLPHTEGRTEGHTEREEATAPKFEPPSP